MNTLLVNQIAHLLNEKGLKIMVAESCTGGLIGHLITNMPGSSEYFLGGVVAYSYEAKERILGVKHATLSKFGAVSQETAIEMACGVRRILAPDFGLENIIGLSVTGIAGPGGGMPGKPVGLVWIGMSTPFEDQAWKFTWNGNREENKLQSAQKTLQLLADYLKTLNNCPTDIHLNSPVVLQGKER